VPLFPDCFISSEKAPETHQIYKYPAPGTFSEIQKPMREIRKSWRGINSINKKREYY
jgi:hypothetical protein